MKGIGGKLYKIIKLYLILAKMAEFRLHIRWIKNIIQII
jgi:hypothetical protein